MDIDDLMTKSNDHYRFHGVLSVTLERLVSQSEDGAIRLWGTDHNDFVDGEEYADYTQGEGYLYCTDISGIELSCEAFCGSDGLVFILEKLVDDPQEWFPRAADKRECLVRVEEWHVIGAIRPIFDEDGDLIDQEALSLEEVLEQ
jgi:hypothetical protein